MTGPTVSDALRCSKCGELQQGKQVEVKLFEVPVCERCSILLSASRDRIRNIEAKALRRLGRPNPPSAA